MLLGSGFEDQRRASGEQLMFCPFNLHSERLTRVLTVFNLACALTSWLALRHFGAWTLGRFWRLDVLVRDLMLALKKNIQFFHHPNFP